LYRLYKAKNSSKFNFRGDHQTNKPLDIPGGSCISSGKILYFLDGAFCLFFILKVVQNTP